MDVKKCGAFLQALRKAKGLTQSQLAEVMCVSPKTVSKWECGDAVPEISALVSLAEFYGVTVDEILKGERACAGVPVSTETEERNTRANNLYLLNKKQDSLKLFTIISVAIIAVGIILQIILLFTVSYTVGVCVNMALSVAACAVFIAGYSLGGGHAEQYLEGENLLTLNAGKLRVKTIIITALVCNAVQAIIPYFFY